MKVEREPVCGEDTWSYSHFVVLGSFLNGLDVLLLSYGVAGREEDRGSLRSLKPRYLKGVVRRPHKMTFKDK